MPAIRPRKLRGVDEAGYFRVEVGAVKPID